MVEGACTMFIIGHQKQRQRLTGLAAQRVLSQGYLFFGPRSVGKSLCALEFAAHLVSEPTFTPTADRPHPFDVQIVRPEIHGKRGIRKSQAVSVETVRETLEFLGRYPAHGRFRVALIEDAQALSVAAQNTLLKTLEEPNPTTAILLIAHEKGTLLETLLSRVERVRFSYVAASETEAGVRTVVPNVSVEKIPPFFFSLGRPGLILDALRRPAIFQQEQAILARLFRLTTLRPGERLTLALELSQDIPQAVKILEWWLPGLHAQAREQTNRNSLAGFFGLLQRTEETLFLLKTTQSNPRLLFEKLLFSL